VTGPPPPFPRARPERVLNIFKVSCGIPGDVLLPLTPIILQISPEEALETVDEGRLGLDGRASGVSSQLRDAPSNTRDSSSKQGVNGLGQTGPADVIAVYEWGLAPPPFLPHGWEGGGVAPGRQETGATSRSECGRQHGL